MRKYREFKRIRTVLIIAAIVIAVLSLFISQSLVKDLSREEQAKMEIFAQAYQSLSDADEDTDLSLVLSVMSGNKTIPVIVVDENNDIKSFLNIEIGKADTLAYLTGYTGHTRALLTTIVLLLHHQVKLVQPVPPCSVFLFIVAQRLQQTDHCHSTLMLKLLHQYMLLRTT